MTTVFWGLGAGTLLVGLAIWVGVRLAERRRWQQQQDISPEWLVENSYRRNGDDRQTK